MTLRDIDALALARDTVTSAVNRVHSIAQGIHAGATARIDGLPEREEASTLGHAALALTRYAQRGEPLDASVHEYCVTLIGAADDALDDAGEPDPETTLGLVVAAALCREALERGEPVSTSRLAVLGSVTDGRIRQLVASGDLRASKHDGDSMVRADDARRWLSGRGVQVVRSDR